MGQSGQCLGRMPRGCSGNARGAIHEVSWDSVAATVTQAEG